MRSLFLAFFFAACGVFVYFICILWFLWAILLTIPFDLSHFYNAAEKIFGCNGDIHCLRISSAILKILSWDQEPLLDNFGVVKIISFTACLFVPINYVFFRSRHRSNVFIESKKLKNTLLNIDQNFKDINIVLTRRKDMHTGQPYSKKGVIYFPAALLASKDMSRFMIYHEYFHSEITSPYERIIFSIFTPLYILSFFLSLPMSYMVIALSGLPPFIVSILVFSLPYILLRKIKKLLYLCIESTADLYAINKYGTPSEPLMKSIQNIRKKTVNPAIQDYSLNPDNLSRFIERKIKYLCILLSLFLSPFGFLSINLSNHMIISHLFDVKLFFLINGLFIFIFLIYTQFSLPHSLNISTSPPKRETLVIRLMISAIVVFICIMPFYLLSAHITSSAFSAFSVDMFNFKYLLSLGFMDYLAILLTMTSIGIPITLEYNASYKK